MEWSANSNLKQRLDRIHDFMKRLARPVRIMEVCGTHTVTACRSGLRALLPDNLALLSGPGCPVCVTPADFIDRAILLARRPDAVIATFGDLLRVPGSLGALELEKAKGSRVRIVYSALDALELAAKNGERKVIFLAVGFETTAPGIAWVVRQAAERGVKNFSILGALKTMPAAMAALLSAGDADIDGFLCPGHVSSIIGTHPYEFIGRDYQRPCVIAGFEPLDMVLAIEMLLEQIVSGRAKVRNGYRRAVGAEGNRPARAIIAEVFAPADAEWRGLGLVPGSGLKLKKRFKNHDAETLFPGLDVPPGVDDPECLCGAILRGRAVPSACPLFGRKCTPSSPVGACMVSAEGACAAYYKYCRCGGIARKELFSSAQRGAKADRCGL
ncbi:MAG: hydrogenase formation protein HypD [Kiritimatiellae bacterium]|nr:hydrogenase formation protein HypD [Kiritimatiellia bacterium]